MSFSFFVCLFVFLVFFFFTMVHSKENVSHLHLIYACMNMCMFRTQSFNNSNCPYHVGCTVCFLLFSLTKKKKKWLSLTKLIS